MKLVLGILCGFVLGSVFTVSAQFWSSDDNRGNLTTGYTDSYGNSTYSDNHGRQGNLYQLPPSAAIQQRNPC